MIRRGSLWTQLVLLVLVAVTPFLVLRAYTIAQSWSERQQQAQADVLRGVQVEAERINDEMRSIGQILATLGMLVSTDPADIIANDALLQAAKSTLPPYYAGLAVVDPQGRNIGFGVPQETAGRGATVADRTYFQAALRTRQTVVGAPVVSRSTGVAVIPIARAAVGPDGAVRSVALAAIEQGRLQELLNPAALPPQALITVISADGVVLARSLDPEGWVGKDISGTPSVQEVLQRREGVDIHPSADGVQRVVAFTTLAEAPWLIYVGIPEGVVFQPVRAALLRDSLLALLSLLLTLMLATVVARRIARPLTWLAEDAVAFGAGDLQRRTAVRAGGEIGMLARSFNRMADALERDIAERTRAEGALRASEALLSAVLDALPVGVIIADTDGRIVRMNPTADAIWGIPAETMNWKQYGAWAGYQPGAGEGLGADEWARVWRGEVVVVRPDGQERLVEIGTRRLLGPDQALGGFVSVARDITERKAAEEQLQLQAGLIELSYEPILAWELEGAIVLWNRGCEELYGYTPNEARGEVSHTLLQTAHPLPLATLKAQLRNEGQWVGQLRHRARDGRLVVVESRHELIVSRGRELVLETNRDITAQARAEAGRRLLEQASVALAESLDPAATLQTVARLPLPTLADYATVHLMTATGEAELAAAAHVDPAAEPLLVELDARYWQLPSGPHDPITAAIQTGMAQLLAEVSDAQITAMPEELRQLMRQLHPHSAVIVPLQVRGARLGALRLATTAPGRRYDAVDVALAEELARRCASAIDNARRYYAEQQARADAQRALAQVRSLQQATEMMVAATTPEVVAATLVHTLAKLFDTREVALAQVLEDGETVEIRAVAGDAERRVAPGTCVPLASRSPLTDAIRAGEPLFLESSASVTAEYPDMSQTYWALHEGAWAALPLHVDGRSPIGGIHLMFGSPRRFPADERAYLMTLAQQGANALDRARLQVALSRYATELEERVAARTIELEQANVDLEQFASIAAHDLRAPLRAIQGFTIILEEDYPGALDALGEQYLARIGTAAAQMDQLVQDLLQYSRMSRVALELQPVPLAAALADVQAQLAADLERREVNLTVLPPLPAVRAHRTTLTQVLVNLLSNAILFVPPGVRPEVQLWCEVAGTTARLWIADNGIGIAPEHHTRIFQAFERLHGQESYPGTGIGLAIVRRGMERMGGRVGVESAPGQGSRFWVELAVSEAEQS